jgi:hypothetical protein
MGFHSDEMSCSQLHSYKQKLIDMKNIFLISIIPCLTFQIIYGQVEISTGLKELNSNGNVRSITEKYYSRNYKNDESKIANLQSTYVYDFNEKRNILKATTDEMSTSSMPLPTLRLSESGVAYPNINYLKEYNKNLNWKERMLNDNKQSTFISDMLRGMLIKGGNFNSKE